MIEFILVVGNNYLKSNNTYTKNMIITPVNSNMPKEHKAVMRLDVCDYLVTNFSKEKDIILDPFMGFGTTAISAIKHCRRYIGFEISQEYVNLANNRINEYKITDKNSLLSKNSKILKSYLISR